MNKIYFTCGGGLGDVLNTFFTGELTYAFHIKELYPDTKIHVLCSSSNASVKDIFEFHPLFDSINAVSCLGDVFQNAISDLEKDGYKYWSHVFDASKLERRHQKVYLNHDEELAVKKLGKYVAVHPFNSAGTGINATHFEVNTDYNRIIKQVLDAGYTLVQVGGDWKHIPTGSIQSENFEYNHPRFINLVNKFNIRMIANVVMNAHKFIGTSSVWCVVACTNGIPSFMILPVHMSDILNQEAEEGNGLRGTLIKKQGLFYGAAVPELYDSIGAFLLNDLPKKRLDFSEAYPLLRVM